MNKKICTILVIVNVLLVALVLYLALSTPSNASKVGIQHRQCISLSDLAATARAPEDASK